MGMELLDLFRSRIKPQQKQAFLCAFFAVLLVHLYKFTNNLPGHDSIYNDYASQNILGSGRWALSAACGLSSWFDLPWVIGLFCAVWIALTAVVIVTLLRIENPVIIALTGGLLAAAPAVSNTFFFLYTADGYMLAMLLAALAVYWSRIGENRRSRLVLSGVCICVCCGIYQAYVSFALVLAVCYLLYELLLDRHERKDCLRWIVRQVILYTAALAAYWVIWRLLLRITGIGANAYQGISQVGRFDLHTLLTAPIRCVKSVMLYLLQWNVMEHGWTLYSVLSVVFVLAFLAGLVIAIRGSGIRKRRWALILVLVCLAAIIPFAAIWCFTSDSVSYSPRMLQCLSLLPVLGALLFENWARPLTKNLMGLLLAVIVLNNALMANILYFHMDKMYQRTYAEGVEMMIEIHELQETAQLDTILVYGNRSAEVAPDFTDPVTGAVTPVGKIHLLSAVLEDSMLFDYKRTYFFLTNTFGLELQPYAGGDLDISRAEAAPCWPAEGSIYADGTTLVIKLSD